MEKFLYIVDYILFGILGISVAYLFIFSLFSFIIKQKRYNKAIKKGKCLVLVPAYREDAVIMDTVNSLMEQSYPADLYEVVVISDQMEDDTNQLLFKQRVNLMTINPFKSSKAYALNFAINNLNNFDFDFVIILDADNIVEEDFISDINDAFQFGIIAMQAHRVAKEPKSDIAVLDAFSEEINNSIFRLGHVNIGLSSALIGSGMAFCYDWFVKNVHKLTTSWEDKELELLLFKEGIFIEYLSYVYVFDQKTEKQKAFYNQRRRWLASQFNSLSSGFKDLGFAIKNLRLDYLDKLFQWLLLPRVILIGLISVITVVITLLNIDLSVKWWVLLFILFLTFAAAIPDNMVVIRNLKSLINLPVLFILMFLNFFRLKGAGKTFIHTTKGG